MANCTHRGCGKAYEEGGECRYHTGTPVFHEGLKSWSCCEEKNKPVLDFESFMSMEGCTTGTHSLEKMADPPKPVKPLETPAPAMTVTAASGGGEVFSMAAPIIAPRASTPAPSRPIEDDEDDLDAPVEPDTKCKRNGCNAVFVSQEESRLAEAAVCTYHPAPPIFREGSKGYLCCKRRVLEFDEFLKMEGCKTGKHLFVKKNKDTDAPPVDDFVTCRMDHYQTPSQIHASVYAKQADKERSKVTLEEEKIHFDVYLPGSKRFLKTMELYGQINPSASKYQILGTKIELTLAKKDGRSWSLLEKDDQAVVPEGFNLTFGVGGRTGTNGAKDVVLDEGNASRVST